MYQERRETDMNRVRKTARHQAVTGHRKEAVDPREKQALVAILRATITIILLIIAFFMLRWGISIYEEKVWMEHQPVYEESPVMKEVALIEDLDVGSGNAQEVFSDRIEMWMKTEQLVRSVGDLLLRNNIDLAVDRCQEALKLDPYHIGALEHLGHLYYERQMFAEAVNTYIRLLNVDPSRTDFQLALLKALDAYGDPEATIAVALWYQDHHIYNEEVQRYMANAYFMQEEYADAAKAYERALKDSPRDIEVLESLAVSYMRLEQYDKALAALEKQVMISFRDPTCHKRIAICNAQLGKAEDAVQIFGKSAHLFGADTVAMWIQDPMLDPIRMERSFQMFADSVVTEEYRRYLEKMAQSMESADEGIVPQLELPDTEVIDSDLLKRKQPNQ